MRNKQLKTAVLWPEKSLQFASDKVPLYYQLQSILSDQILSGSPTVDSQMPTEIELVKKYGISRITVRQALGAMEEEGLIRREVGRGTFVNAPPKFSENVLQLVGSMDDLISLSMTTMIKVLYVHTVQASKIEAALLGLEPGAQMVRCARIRYFRDQPYSHVINDLPLEIGRQLSRADWKKSVSQILQDKLGVPLIEAEQSIRASLADPELARLLSTRIGAALLSTDRVVKTSNGKPVDRVRTHYRSDIFHFNVRLSRDHINENWSLQHDSSGKVENALPLAEGIRRPKTRPGQTTKGTGAGER